MLKHYVWGEQVLVQPNRLNHFRTEFIKRLIMLVAGGHKTNFA